jgi:hypothetical protein
VKEEDLASDDSERIEALARGLAGSGRRQVSESVVRDEGGESFGEVIDLVAALKGGSARSASRRATPAPSER